MEKYFIFAESNELQRIGQLSNNYETLENEIIFRNEFAEAVNIYITDIQNGYNEVSERIKKILRVNENSNHLDPYDSTIVAYLLLIMKSDPLKIEDALSLISSERLKNLIWTRSTIERLKKAKIRSKTEKTEFLNNNLLNTNIEDVESHIEANHINKKLSDTERIKL